MDIDYKELDTIIKRIVNLIERGYSRGFIISEMLDDLGPLSRKKLFEIAKCRLRARKKFGKLADKLFFDEEGLRYSTPISIAEYRSERLESDSIADLSCGVGIQAIYFAKRSKSVIGVEKDPLRVFLAEMNAFALGLKNIDFIKGDATSDDVVKKIDAEILFSDPSRRAEEEFRTLRTLEPSPLKIYDIYRKISDKIAFELPPQISRDRIKIDGEKEYTSLDFKLNRLALYTGSLKTCDVSAISLPSKERITDEDERCKLLSTDDIKEYIYEVDPTIIKANLLENLAGNLGFDGFLLYADKRRVLLTSNEIYCSAFLRRYIVRKVCRFTIERIKNFSRKLGAGKVTLRMHIDPRNYWSLRKRIEEGLTGDKNFYLFKVNNRAILAEKESE